MSSNVITTMKEAGYKCEPKHAPLCGISAGTGLILLAIASIGAWGVAINASEMGAIIMASSIILMGTNFFFSKWQERKIQLIMESIFAAIIMLMGAAIYTGHLSSSSAGLCIIATLIVSIPVKSLSKDLS